MTTYILLLIPVMLLAFFVGLGLYFAWRAWLQTTDRATPAPSSLPASTRWKSHCVAGTVLRVPYRPLNDQPDIAETADLNESFIGEPNTGGPCPPRAK